jgi:hypothetical protein
MKHSTEAKHVYDGNNFTRDELRAFEYGRTYQREKVRALKGGPPFDPIFCRYVADFTIGEYLVSAGLEKTNPYPIQRYLDEVRRKNKKNSP